MPSRKITKYAIYGIAALSATLINQLLVSYLKKHIHMHGYWLVLADMLIVVLIFTPAFALVSKYTKKISKAYMKTSKKITNARKGTFYGIAIAFCILFVLYALLRHDINVLNDLTSLQNK